MYLALYRKYRPQTFQEVIGQNHIVKTLINQVNNDKIGHAYLFCGSRGTGKTSTAKIFAKAINCLKPNNGSPCLECEVCKALGSNNIDVLEIDAASNNGVDEIRDLREKVKYPPVNGKYKVYIIDEVHMLSPSAFNALLKTLEEPPAYAVFILATTEVHKLPATILSRCLRFDFGLVSVDELSVLLEKIFKEENVKAEKEAINIIARAGEGSVRDTLSIADRCISYSGENLTASSVMEVLGTTDKEHLFNIADAILNKNLGESLKELDNVLSSGKSPLVLSKDMIAYFRDLLVLQTLKDDGKNMVIANAETFEKMKTQAVEENYSTIISAITNLGEIEAELRYSTSPRIVLETAVVKTLSVSNLLDRIENLEKQIVGGVKVQQVVSNAEEKKTEQQLKQSIEQKTQNDANDQAILGEILNYLRENKEMSLLAVIRQVSKVLVENNVVKIYVDDKSILDLTSREKNKIVLSTFFNSKGLSYQFILNESKSIGDVESLNQMFGNKFEIKE